MTDVFENPWLLLLVAFTSTLVIGTYRAVFPEKARRWQWMIPLSIAAMAFLMDAVVQTDMEKIRRVLRQAMKAAQQEDVARIEPLISSSYNDSLHQNKRALLYHLRSGLGRSPVSEVTGLSLVAELQSASQAQAQLNLNVVFDPRSDVATQYKPSMRVTLRFILGKQPDSQWLIDRTELVEVDRYPMTWGQTSGSF